MKKPGLRRLVVAAALLALPGLAIGPAAPEAHAAPRDGRSAFPFRMPWQEQAKPARRPRRAQKPAPQASPTDDRAPASAAVATGVPLPRPAPQPKIDATTEPQTATTATEMTAPAPRRPSEAAETTGTGARDDALPDGDAAGAARAADFAAIRLGPTPEPPPLPPLPSEPEPALPKGRIAYGVPLPPEKESRAEPETDDGAHPGEPEVAMTPRAPLDGPPLPGPPDDDTPPPVLAPGPDDRESDSDCKALVSENVAIASPLPPLLGPGSCGAPLPVELTGVRLKDGSTVEIKPAATLRCGTARAIARYVRDDLAPAAEKAGPALIRVQTAASYICRGRNNRANAKMSEHGLANALDIAGFAFKGGAEFGVYSKDLPQAFSEIVKSAACERFATVLGPGSDGFHEEHLHVDMRQRRNAGSKLCRWSPS